MEHPKHNSQHLDNVFVSFPQQDLEELKRKVDFLNASIRNRNQQDLDSEWLSNHDVCKMLGISIKTWQEWRNTRKIPFSQFGRKIYVRRTDLNNFLMSCRISHH